VEVCQVQGVAGELLAVELNEESVVFLGELPDDFVGDPHLYLSKIHITIRTS
jgi:hypothetical protein